MSTFCGSFRMFHRRVNAFEPADGAQADVEVKSLSQRHVQRADAAADGSHERTFDADVIVCKSLDCVFGKIGSELLKRPSSGEDFEPVNAALTAIGLADGGVDDFHHGGSDFRADAVTGDEGNINGVGHVKNGFGGESDF